jgi:hypothetical protein
VECDLREDIPQFSQHVSTSDDTVMLAAAIGMAPAGHVTSATVSVLPRHRPSMIGVQSCTDVDPLAET